MKEESRDEERAPLEKPKVLLYVVNDAWFLASHRFELVQAAVERGHVVHVAGRHDATADRFIAMGCHFHAWRLAPRSTGPRAELIAFASLARIVRTVRPDLIHLVTIKSLVYGGLIARAVRVPAVVFAVAGLGNYFVASRARDRFVRFVASTAYRVVLRHPNAHVIVQNASDHHYFLSTAGLPVESVTRLPGSGVDLDRFEASREPAGEVKVLLASRLLWKKGIAEFIEAARVLRKSAKPVRFVLAGTIDEENPESVRHADVERWADEGLVEWHGPSDDMPGMLRECHLLCLPTYYGEGLPKILIEACASARAVICTDWPGCNEIIEHGLNGWLVPPRDSAALAKAIGELATDPARRRSLGRAGREIAERGYAVDAVVERTIDIYTRLFQASINRSGR